MTCVAFTSTKHSPGVTTTAVAFAMAAAIDGPTLLIELDPAGGDLAALCGLSLQKGLISYAANARHTTTDVCIADHAQRHGDVDVLVAPTSPEQSISAIERSASRLVVNARSHYDHVVVDLGRFGSHVAPIARHCDVAAVVLRPTLAAVEHVRSRIETLRSIHDLHLLAVGSSPYSPAEVTEVTNLPLLGTLPHDRRDAGLVIDSPTASATRKCGLLRSARSILSTVVSTPTEEMATA